MLQLISTKLIADDMKKHLHDRNAKCYRKILPKYYQQNISKILPA